MSFRSERPGKPRRLYLRLGFGLSFGLGLGATYLLAGLGQALEDDNATAFAAHKAIGGGIKGFTAPIGRQHPGIAENKCVILLKDQVDATGQGEKDLDDLGVVVDNEHQHPRLSRRPHLCLRPHPRPASRR